MCCCTANARAVISMPACLNTARRRWGIWWSCSPASTIWNPPAFLRSPQAIFSAASGTNWSAVRGSVASPATSSMDRNPARWGRSIWRRFPTDFRKTGSISICGNRPDSIRRSSCPVTGRKAVRGGPICWRAMRPGKSKPCGFIWPMATGPRSPWGCRGSPENCESATPPSCAEGKVRWATAGLASGIRSVSIWDSTPAKWRCGCCGRASL